MSKPTYTSTILITGGTQGLGYEAALSLARQCPQSLVVIASRTDPDKAATRINTKLNQQNVTYMPLDLSSLSTVRFFAQTWGQANHPPTSALVLNAGTQLPGSVEYTTDVIEKHFAINHTAHALLFHLFLPHLTPNARIIVVASSVHDPVQAKTFGMTPTYTTPGAVAAPNDQQAQASNGRDRYCTSKAANVIWTFALGHHMSSHPSHSQMAVLAFDPGLMFGTKFTRHAHPILGFLNKYIAPYTTRVMRWLVHDNINSPSESGGNLAWLVVDASVEGKKGVYFEKRRARESST